jgi:hypothetical protein
MKAKRLLCLFLIISILFLLNGCVAAYVGGVTADALRGLEKTKINAAVSPGVTKEQLQKIKRVAILFDEATGTGVLDSGLSDILADNIAIELLKLGYECIGKEQLIKNLESQGLKIAGAINLENVIKAGKLMGVHAIIAGKVKSRTSYKGSSAFFSMKMTSAALVQSATLKVLDPKEGDSLMMISISYKNGKKTDSASKSMAKILKAKLENPFGKITKK